MRKAGSVRSRPISQRHEEPLHRWSGSFKEAALRSLPRCLNEWQLTGTSRLEANRPQFRQLGQLDSCAERPEGSSGEMNERPELGGG